MKTGILNSLLIAGSGVKLLLSDCIKYQYIETFLRLEQLVLTLQL